MSLLRILIPGLILISSLAPASAQSKAVERFVAETEDVQKFFIYQSSLRMLNQKGDDDFNRLIRDIRKINVYIAEQGAGAARSKYQGMISELGKDNFETLVSVKADAMYLNLMGKETGDRAFYVLAGMEEDSFAVLEMDGKLDLRYLSAIEQLDVDKLRKIVGQDEGSQQTEKKQDIED